MSVRRSLGVLILVTAAPLLAQSGPKTVAADTGSLPLLHRPVLVYPKEARAKRAEGTVTLDLSVNAEGLVTDARVLSGPEELRKGALQSVLNWHYVQPGAPTHVQVRLDYAAPAPIVAGPSSGVLKSVEIDPSVAAPVREALLARLQPLEGKAMTAEASAQIADILEMIEPHSVLSFRRDETGNTLAFIRGEATARNPEFAASPSGVKRITVGGDVMATKLTQKTPPVYPELAKQARIQGQVRFDVLIGTDGQVKSVSVISGHPILVPSAMEAVRHWMYQPTLLNGQPCEVQTQVDVSFTLLL